MNDTSDNAPDARHAGAEAGLGLRPARLSWQEQAPHAIDFNDVYFSREGGLDETHHVFIQHNRLTERFIHWHAERPFVIGETGFGSGLNMLCAWRHFIEHAPPEARLHLVSVERFPFSREQLERALAAWPSLTFPARALIQQWPAPVAGVHRLQLDDRVTLDLHLGDAVSRLAALDGQVDAWFLDGFAPGKNPDMWQPALFEAIAAASRPQATLATFTCAGLVRRGLAAVGFHCEKVAGFGRKREMLRGRLSASDDASDTRPDPTIDRHRTATPWFTPPRPARGGDCIAVIGAGIAGATVAHALARRGRRVTVFDPQPPGSAASGNRQAALYVRLAAELNPQSRFYLSALQYTLGFLARLDPHRQLWQDCGLLQLATSQREAERQRRCLARFNLPETLLTRVDRVRAEALAGVALAESVTGGLYYPSAGWVRPDALCRALMTTPNIAYRASRVNALERCRGQWQLVLDDGEPAGFDQVVLACAGQGGTLLADTELPDAALPVQPVRGQVSEFELAEAALSPQCVVCAGGYAPPVLEKVQSIGASFSPNDDDCTLRERDHDYNLSQLAGVLPTLAAHLTHAPVHGRSGIRCASPDKSPYIGPLPDAERWRRDYAVLGRDATRIPALAGRCLPGLWTSMAHGSRGLVSAPLAAELLASRLCDEPMPLSAELVDHVHPGRRLIRDLIRRH